MKGTVKETIGNYREYLRNEEKAIATVNKYVHDVFGFLIWLGKNTLTKSAVLDYKRRIMSSRAAVSVNSIISSLNNFFRFCQKPELCVKTLKIQRPLFSPSGKELTKEEYERLIQAAEDMGNERLSLLMQTLCSMGIRVSELQFVTVEAIEAEEATISCKGKTRKAIIPEKLCRRLKRYVKEKKILSGFIFRTKNGNPMDRSNIWSEMKKLCERAGVAKEKVFPHNLRHLFARTYYSVQNDIVRLADVLGHASVDTTRIYTVESSDTHRKQIQSLGLLRC